MFDQYIVCEEGFRARDDGRTGGVVEVRMPYYRGLTLSMVEAVDLTLDGSPSRPSRTTFTVHGNTYAFDRAAADHRRPLGDGGAARSWPSRPTQPLAPGEHDVAVAVRLRISYMPVPGGGRDRKRLTLAA